MPSMLRMLVFGVSIILFQLDANAQQPPGSPLGGLVVHKPLESWLTGPYACVGKCSADLSLTVVGLQRFASNALIMVGIKFIRFGTSM
jgi:hypothetical protein